ncbi:hypothetical protein [uncultured Thalassolituus sp.]|uniref:hypothetical protein n=1 Tax=uncultured Thalassolituus sp. TaxID=285273 RepID=UPI002605FC3B|nr:hypothetical protein [uncultured Thalassolituus sp.]
MKSLLLIPFLGISAMSVAEPVFVDQVSAGCSKVTEATCWTQKSDAEEHCRSELSRQAEEENADTLIVTLFEQQDMRKPSLVGGVKVVTKTQMSADLYRCTQTPSPQTHAEPGETIEQRLLKLKDLKEKALISEEEYADLRQKILNEI